MRGNVGDVHAIGRGSLGKSATSIGQRSIRHLSSTVRSQPQWLSEGRDWKPWVVAGFAEAIRAVDVQMSRAIMGQLGTAGTAGNVKVVQSVMQDRSMRRKSMMRSSLSLLRKMKQKRNQSEERKIPERPRKPKERRPRRSAKNPVHDEIKSETSAIYHQAFLPPPHLLKPLRLAINETLRTHLPLLNLVLRTCMLAVVCNKTHTVMAVCQWNLHTPLRIFKHHIPTKMTSR